MGEGKVEHLLSAITESETFHAPGAEGDQALFCLVGVGDILFWVEKSEKAARAFGHFPDANAEYSESEEHGGNEVKQAGSRDEEEE